MDSFLYSATLSFTSSTLNGLQSIINTWAHDYKIEITNICVIHKRSGVDTSADRYEALVVYTVRK